MSTVQARMAAIAWKKSSLERLKQTVGLLREFHSNLDKLCSSVKAVVGDVYRDANQIIKQYDKYLDEGSERYEQDYDAMSALQEVSSADEEADDVKLQAGDSLDGLLSHLNAIIATVREVKL